jgi:hypothetical protein
MVQKAIFGPFACPISTLSCILMLVLGINLPTINTKSAYYVLNLITDDELGSITNKLLRQYTSCNTILHVFHKVPVRFDTMDIGNLSVRADKYKCGDKTIIKSGNIGIDNITRNCLIRKCNIKGQIW